MKRFAASLLAALAAASAAQAGSFGPPPFSNGSPLVTGVDGSYQASARAQNVTGIFRFQYSSGIQTAASRENSWVFFVNGQVQRGTVTAAIGEGKVSGVLDSLTAGTSTNSNGTIRLPIILLNANNASSGEFNGKMAKDGSFSGKGQLLPAAAQQNQVVAISQETITTTTGASYAGPITITSTNYSSSAGSIPPTVFKFRGVRNTSIASSSSTSSGSTSSTTGQ